MGQGGLHQGGGARRGMPGAGSARFLMVAVAGEVPGVEGRALRQCLRLEGSTGICVFGGGPLKTGCKKSKQAWEREGRIEDASLWLVGDEGKNSGKGGQGMGPDGVWVGGTEFKVIAARLGATSHGRPDGHSGVRSQAAGRMQVGGRHRWVRGVRGEGENAAVL